jgi:DUF4097 and DUF4098 domain-containing protein YvlB
MVMNKMEYLNALKEALKDTDESVMEEIISDYEEHFQVGIEKGKSEEQICEELGSINDLVDEIKEVYRAENSKRDKEDENQTNSNDRKSGERRFNIPNFDGEKIGDAINSALDSAGEAISKIDVIEIGHTLKNTLEQATSSINIFADTYLKNSFDFNRGNAEGSSDNVSKSYETGEKPEDGEKSNVSYDYENANLGTEETSVSPDAPADDTVTADTKEAAEQNTEQQKTSEGRNEEDQKTKTGDGLNLVINGECADVTIVKSQNQKVNINYVNNGNERQKQFFEFYSYKEGNTVYAGIRRVGKAVFLFHLNHNSMHIHVELPESMNYMDVKTASGDIKLFDVKADRIMIGAASGEISLKQVISTDLRIKCASGDINLETVNSVQLNAGTMSGDIRADGIDAKFLSMKSVSGDMEAGSITADIIDTSSMSGEIKLHQVKVSESKIRSTSGDIDIDEMNMNNTDASCMSGKIKIQKICGDGLVVGSTSGNINLDVNVKRCHASSKSGNVDAKCEGDIVLESNSTSGNIKVGLKNYGGGYRVESRTTSGVLNIKYQDMIQSNLKSGTYTYGKQGSELMISTVSGNIRLTD